MRVLVTAGGTGGHIYPLIAVISELQAEAKREEKKIRIRYVGAAKRNYRRLLRESGIEVKTILGSRLRRYFSLANLVDVPKFFISIVQALWKLYWFMPDVVFSKGGSGSVAVVLIARFYRIPVVIHETDSIPSLTSKITGRFAKVIAISFESSSDYFDKRKGTLILTGNPVRQSILGVEVSHDKAKASLGFDRKLPLMLVLGGSQGALRINDFILDNLRDFLPITQIFHQTGEKNYDQVVKEFSVIDKRLPEELRGRYKAVGRFEKDIGIAFTACDIVLSRAGGGIFEIAAFRKPSILVPLPGAAYSHQLHNALEYEKFGATIVFEEENLLPHLFLDRLKQLFSDPNELVTMSKATELFYRPGAALNLAKIILTIKDG